MMIISTIQRNFSVIHFLLGDGFKNSSLQTPDSSLSKVFRNELIYLPPVFLRREEDALDVLGTLDKQAVLF